MFIPFSGLHSVHLKLRWPPVIASARSRRICRWRKGLYTIYTIYNKGNVGNNCLSLVTLGLPPIWYIRIKRKWSLLLISLDKRVLSTHACVLLDINYFILFFLIIIIIIILNLGRISWYRREQIYRSVYSAKLRTPQSGFPGVQKSEFKKIKFKVVMQLSWSSCPLS